jgi:hypothetical protein
MVNCDASIERCECNCQLAPFQQQWHRCVCGTIFTLILMLSLTGAATYAAVLQGDAGHGSSAAAAAAADVSDQAARIKMAVELLKEAGDILCTWRPACWLRCCIETLCAVGVLRIQ